jgi:hypothetical protein
MGTRTILGIMSTNRHWHFVNSDGDCWGLITHAALPREDIFSTSQYKCSPVKTSAKLDPLLRDCDVCGQQVIFSLF